MITFSTRTEQGTYASGHMREGEEIVPYTGGEMPPPPPTYRRVWYAVLDVEETFFGKGTSVTSATTDFRERLDLWLQGNPDTRAKLSALQRQRI